MRGVSWNPCYDWAGMAGGREMPAWRSLESDQGRFAALQSGFELPGLQKACSGPGSPQRLERVEKFMNGIKRHTAKITIGRRR
jgi:hypothetical protein